MLLDLLNLFFCRNLSPSPEWAMLVSAGLFDPFVAHWFGSPGCMFISVVNPAVVLVPIGIICFVVVKSQNHHKESFNPLLQVMNNFLSQFTLGKRLGLFVFVGAIITYVYIHREISSGPDLTSTGTLQTLPLTDLHRAVAFYYRFVIAGVLMAGLSLSFTLSTLLNQCWSVPHRRLGISNSDDKEWEWANKEVWITWSSGTQTGLSPEGADQSPSATPLTSDRKPGFHFYSNDEPEVPFRPKGELMALFQWHKRWGWLLEVQTDEVRTGNDSPITEALKTRLNGISLELNKRIRIPDGGIHQFAVALDGIETRKTVFFVQVEASQSGFG